ALSALADAYAKLGLPLRSVENEWGPGQVECTFAASDALSAADNVLLFRTATRQVCRRIGHFATFMCRPGIKGGYSSGWHLHQSMIDRANGRNLFTPERDGEVLSPLGRMFVAGLLEHAAACSAFTTPTINGYRRFRPNSLAPDRATWCYDHRGVMIRALGGVGDPATRVENRVGEPAANPYLFIASQIVAGLDGVAPQRRPRPGGEGGLLCPPPRRCRSACRRRSTPSSVSSCSAVSLATCSSTIFSSSSATRPGASRVGSRRPAPRTPARTPPTGSSASIS